MKQKTLLKTVLLAVLALVGGVNTARADEVAVTVNNDSELKTAYETAYNSEIAGTTVITMNAGTYTCDGMSYNQLQMPKVRSVTLQAAEGAKVTLTTKVVSDGGGTPTGSLTFKGIFLKSSNDTFINITSCGNVDHISFIDCDITAVSSTHKFLIRYGNASYTLNTISFNGCVIHDMGNGYYLIDPTHKVQNVSFTNSTIYNYNGDQLFRPETASDDVFTFVFNNNTVFKCGSNNRVGIIYTNEKYTNASNTFTFKDNIFWDRYGTGDAHVFYSRTGAGTVIQNNNVLYNYDAEWNTGSYTKDYTNLDYTGSIPFYDAENHNFGIHPSHTLATASTTGGVVGDPRWLIVCLNEASDYTCTAQSYAVVELTRSITADNWNTIVLPFAMTNEQLKSAFGEHVAVAELTSGSNTELTFSSVTETVANKPYAIKVSSSDSYSGTATINGVNIVNDTPTQSVTNWNFVGTYSKTTISEGNYYFKSNQLYKAGTGSHNIKPFRAYLEYTGAGGALAPMLNFIIDGGTTAIGTIKADGTMMTLNESTVYSLSGQRVAKPSKGVYIVNGKKVIFK